MAAQREHELTISAGPEVAPSEPRNLNERGLRGPRTALGGSVSVLMHPEQGASESSDLRRCRCGTARLDGRGGGRDQRLRGTRH